MPRNTDAIYALSTTTSRNLETVEEPSPAYSTTGSTALPVKPDEEALVSQVRDPVAAWQMSSNASRYRGRWVALDEASGRVIAVADSPTDFDEESTADATLVFVRPSGPLPRF
jgi:hypothetical protein